jgi:hypothetical protein
VTLSKEQNWKKQKKNTNSVGRQSSKTGLFNKHSKNIQIMAIGRRTWSSLVWPMEWPLSRVISTWETFCHHHSELFVNYLLESSKTGLFNKHSKNIRIMAIGRTWSSQVRSMEWPLSRVISTWETFCHHHSELFVNYLLDPITVKQGGRLPGRFLGFITVALNQSKTRFR